MAIISNKNLSIKICRYPYQNMRGVRWPSGRASDSGARGRGFDTYLLRVVSLWKDTFTSRKVLVHVNAHEAVAPSRHD